jgi:hypothetical protein
MCDMVLTTTQKIVLMVMVALAIALLYCIYLMATVRQENIYCISGRDGVSGEYFKDCGNQSYIKQRYNAFLPQRINITLPDGAFYTLVLID